MLNLEGGENECDIKKVSSNISGNNIITCDHIFALFLIENSKVLNYKLYKTFVIFVKLYRECMNKLGWEILSIYKDLGSELTSLEFTSVKNGEHLPEIANDFINIYLPNNLPDFDKYLAVLIVNHFCDWIYKFKFTHMKLKFLNEEGM